MTFVPVTTEPLRPGMTRVLMILPGGTGIVQSIVAGANITIDATDPANPIIAATIPPGSGFPIGPLDDGTATYKIVAGAPFPAGVLAVNVVHDATSNTGTFAIQVTATSTLSTNTMAVSGGGSSTLAYGGSGNNGVAILTATDDLGNTAGIQCAAASGFSTLVSLSAQAVHVDCQQLEFFGVPAVVQQPTPVTLVDVIALLQAYGLCP